MLEDISLASFHINVVCSNPTAQKLFVHINKIFGNANVACHQTLSDAIRENTKARIDAPEKVIYIIDTIPEINPISEIRFFKNQLHNSAVIITYDDAEGKNCDPFECLDALSDMGRKLSQNIQEPLEVYIQNSENRMNEHKSRVEEIILPNTKRSTMFSSKEECQEFLDKVQFEIPAVRFASLSKPLTMRSYMESVQKAIYQDSTDPLVQKMRAYEKAVSEEVSKMLESKISL